MSLSLTDLESTELGDLAHLGEARLGSEDTVAPISFMDFDEKGKPREVRGTIPARDLIGNVHSIGASALSSANAAYKGMTLEDKLIIKGALGTDDAGAIKLLAETQAHELVQNLFKSRSSFRLDGNNLKVGRITVSNVSVDGEKGAASKLQLPEVKKSGFFGLPFKTT